MRDQSSISSLVPLFQTLEEHLHNHNFELALYVASSILAFDRNNFYALAIERRTKRLLDFMQDPSEISDSTKYYVARVIAALEHVCQMAVQLLTKLPVEA